MWPLLGCSIFALAIVADRALAHWLARLDFNRFVANLRQLILEGRHAEAASFAAAQRGPLARTAETYLLHLDEADASRGAIVHREGSIALEGIEARQRGLAAVANLATLLGLLGTVTGLVDAFRHIELAGGQVQPGDLASGIWEALLTTVFGLGIAIPAHAAFHLFESRADRTARRMGFLISHLDQWFGKVTAVPTEATVAGAAKDVVDTPSPKARRMEAGGAATARTAKSGAGAGAGGGAGPGSATSTE